jgi:hypothetical protein
MLTGIRSKIRRFIEEPPPPTSCGYRFMEKEGLFLQNIYTFILLLNTILIP